MECEIKNRRRVPDYKEDVFQLVEGRRCDPDCIEGADDQLEEGEGVTLKNHAFYLAQQNYASVMSK